MNAEMHERTVIALARAACTPFYVEDDIDLLCWHCGVKREELQGVKVTGYRIADQKAMTHMRELMASVMRDFQEVEVE